MWNRRPTGFLIVATAAVLAVSALSFAYGRDRGSSENVAVAEPALPEPPDINALPTPGAPIDTAKPFWGVPYLNEDRSKPRFDQLIAGIQVGPTVKVASSGFCKAGEAKVVTSAAGTPFELVSDSIPATYGVDRDWVIECAGKVVAAERDYSALSAPGVGSKVLSGEISWFGSEHGSSLYVGKGYKQYPAHLSTIPAERWRAGTVAGLPAAIAGPILEPDFGNAMVVVWDEEQQIQTAVTGNNVPLALLIAIAEDLLR